MQNLESQSRSYSMAGEDVLIGQILDAIGVKSKFCIEFGAMDGYKNSNTRYFINQGWAALLIDSASQNEEIKSEWITAENINSIFKKYKVPKEVDFISIDMDGNDYWVWKAMELKPRIVCIEYNASYGGDEDYIMKYNPHHVHDKQLPSKDFGAAAKPMIKLGEEKGYQAVYEMDFNNIIFIKQDELKDNIILPGAPKLGRLIKDGLSFLPNPNNIYK